MTELKKRRHRPLSPTDSTPLLADAHTWAFPRASSVASDELSELGELPAYIGEYRVLQRLGSGGMGEVFLAYDEALSRHIALKRVRPDRSAEELRRRFDVEARVTALLQHPSIIPVYDWSNHESGAFYTMRPVEGVTFAQLLERLRQEPSEERRDWPTARLVRLFLQAANAVAYAHSQGVIHRDLKPSNIMLGPFEEVLVLDWGMAKISDEEQAPESGLAGEGLAKVREETASSVLVGTPGYISPEQLAGRAADARSDVFALGVILYELLALRLPWQAETVNELCDIMTRPPQDPTLVQPRLGIPGRLGAVVLRALEHAPEDRYQSVVEFSSEVAHALEGRASWKVERVSLEPKNWRIQQGRVRRESGALVLRSRGEQRSLRYFCTERFGQDVGVDFDVRLQGRADLSVWLSASSGRDGRPQEGYSLGVLPGRRRTLSLLRSGRVVGGAKSPPLAPRRWYRVSAKRESDHLTLLIDGEEIYAYSDPIPLPGGFVGLTGQAGELRVRNLRVSSLGTSAMVSCLSVPDAFFNRGLYEEARAEYDAVAQSHPGRSEGRLARFRAGMCLIEMCRRETDPDVCALLLEEASQAFRSGTEETCLTYLGLALVADEARLPNQEHDALARALDAFPDDPNLAVAHEWLLSRLHRLDLNERLTAAELLPLAIEHCLGGWARQLIQDLVRKVRRSWETPSFLSGRSRLRQGDLASRADATLLFAFWAGRGPLIAATVNRLLEAGQARPHHLADAYFALLELGRRDLASDVWSTAPESAFDPASSDKMRRILSCCGATERALGGDLEGAFAQLFETESRPSDRPFNSARLWLARAASPANPGGMVQRALKQRSLRDTFAREHLAWFALESGDLRKAETYLHPFVQSGQHRSGRNLSNFLYGCLLLHRGDLAPAMHIFSALPSVQWPRTWTLGSYLASGRLGNGSVERYRQAALPWEQAVLDSHIDQLALACGVDRERVSSGEALGPAVQ